MGLDGVELVMTWEERFGIAIPDEATKRMRTPRMAMEYIHGTLAHPRTATCLTQRTFYRVRATFAARLGPVARRLHPSADLAALLPWDTRAATWTDLGLASGLQQWPELQRPTWVTALILSGAAGIPCLAWARGLVTPGWCVALGLLLLDVGYRVTRPLARGLPPHARTAAALTRHLAGYNAEVLVPPQERWTYEQVRAVVRATIVDQIGVRPDFSDDAEFVKDLGLS